MASPILPPGFQTLAQAQSVINQLAGRLQPALGAKAAAPNLAAVQGADGLWYIVSLDYPPG